MPRADALYFADAKWWEWNRDDDRFKVFSGEKCTIFSTGNLVGDPAVHMLRNFDTHSETDVGAVSADPAGIFSGRNSGYQAVNIAALAGARRIVLVGYDAKAGAGGRPHFFGNHPDKSEAPYVSMLRHFSKAAPTYAKLGIEILNASPGSALTMFPQVDLLEAMREST